MKADNQMLRRYCWSVVVVAFTFPPMAQPAEPIPQPRADRSTIEQPLSWKQAAPSAFARVESPAAAVRGSFFVFGGFTDSLDASNRVDVYNPQSDTWTRHQDMPVGLTHLNAAVDGDHIWFAGGFKGKHPGPATTFVWKYETASDRWVAGPPLPEPRGGRPGGGRPQAPLLRRLPG